MSVNGKDFGIPLSLDPASIGNILVEEGHLTDVELVELVRRYEIEKEKDERLGQFIIQHSKVTQENVDKALEIQKYMKKSGRNSLRKVVNLSSRSHKRAMNAMDEVVDLAQQAIKANGH